MSEPKKYESLGVDAEKQKSEPTLVEKAQEAERKQKKHTSISSPEQIADALTGSTTNHQDYVNGPREQGTSREEEFLTGAHYSQEELSPSTTGPSIKKAKEDEGK